MTTPAVPALLLVLTLVLSGCALAHSGPHMPYEDAKQELIRLVETPLLATLNGKRPSFRPLTGEDPCDDALGNPIDEVSFGYEYEFPLDLLGDNPERLLLEAERVWREEGLTVEVDNSNPNIPAVFAGNQRGFNLSAVVNHLGDGLVSVGGSGPCVEPPEPAPTSQ